MSGLFDNCIRLLTDGRVCIGSHDERVLEVSVDILKPCSITSHYDVIEISYYVEVGEWVEVNFDSTYDSISDDRYPLDRRVKSGYKRKFNCLDVFEDIPSSILFIASILKSIAISRRNSLYENSMLYMSEKSLVVPFKGTVYVEKIDQQNTEIYTFV